MNVEKLIFQEILEFGKYTISERPSHFSMTNLVEFIIHYSDLGVIKYAGDELTLTENGIKYLRMNRNKIFFRKDDRVWADIPKYYISQDLDTERSLKVILKGVKHISY